MADLPYAPRNRLQEHRNAMTPEMVASFMRGSTQGGGDSLEFEDSDSELSPGAGGENEMPTLPSRCKVRGAGLYSSVVRRLTTFQIEARDEDGRRQTAGEC